MPHTGTPQISPRTFNVTVSSGTGSLELKFGGNVIGYSVKTANDTESFAIRFEDGDGYHLDSKAGNVGDMVRHQEFQLWYNHAKDYGPTAFLTSATDGLYKVRVWFKA